MTTTRGEDRHPFDPVGRLRVLLDEDFHLPDGAGTTGVVFALGRVEAIPVVAFACDPRRHGGALGSAECQTIVNAYDHALRERLPIIGLWHSAGAELADGVASLHGVATIFAAMTRASGVIPQISVVLGPAAGGAAYGPALTDIVVLAAEGRLFVTGPGVVRSVTGEDVDMAALGGPEAHAKYSGVAHVVAGDEAQALAQARLLTTLLGLRQRCRVSAGPRVDPTDVDPTHLVPEDPRHAYDVHPLVNALFDAVDESVELQPRYAPNVVTALGRLGGRTVGVVANNPLRMAGCLDGRSAQKAARFVRMCDALGVPLVVLVDVPGYLPGTGQEHGGVVRRGAALLHAFAEATVPRVTVVTRKAYGGAYVAMNSCGLGATKVLAWPKAQIGVMGVPAAVAILYRRELAAAAPKDRPALEARLCVDYQQRAGSLQRALELGVIDEIIEPHRTRLAIDRVLAESGPGRGHHTNIPL